jgi:predicted transcriptional regulator
MGLISLKLPDALDAELAARAQLRRLSKSELMRRALKAYLQTADSTEAQPAPSAFDRVAHLAGFGER